MTDIVKRLRGKTPNHMSELIYHEAADKIEQLEQTIAALAGEARSAEQERLTFDGDLDKWMKIIGAGITGSQPEAYAMMDHACGELVRARAKIETLTEVIKLVKDHSELEDEVLDVIDAVLGEGEEDR